MYLRKTLLMLLGIFIMILGSKCRSENKPHGIEIDRNEYPIFGIDLSEYSGNANFSKLKEEVKIDFVFLRVSAGKDYKDKLFEENYKKAIESGYTVGYYHYYRFNENPIEQADFFVNEIISKSQILPIVIDVEDWRNKKDGKSNDEIVEEIKLFINHVESKIQKEVIIYTNESSYNSYVHHKISGCEIWICSFKKDEKVNGDWLFWQYSHKGKFKAIDGWVDLNTFNGSIEDWNKFLTELGKKNEWQLNSR